MCCYLVDYENIMPRKAAELQGFVRGDTVIVCGCKVSSGELRA